MTECPHPGSDGDFSASRRSFLRLTLQGALASVAGWVSMGRASIDEAPAMKGTDLYATVARYAAFGHHQTGTRPDLETADWLVSRLEAAGLEAQKVPFTSQQFHLDDHRLAVNGEEVASYPLWWPTAGQGRGPCQRVADTNSPPDLTGKVALLEISTTGGRMQAKLGQSAAINAAIDAGAVGVIAVTRHPSGELMALNAMDGLIPWRVPVVIIGSRVAGKIDNGDMVEILVDGRMAHDTRAFEVIGHFGDKAGEQQVVSTPYSGWFACAGERGPGIATWLGIAEWLGRTKPKANFTMVASSGHELNGVGIHHFMAHDAPPPERTTNWLHLGAGMATFSYDPESWQKLDRVSRLRRVTTNDESMMPILERHLPRIGIEPKLTSTPGGEMAYMAAQGYKVWGFAGGSALHHLMEDTPERIVGPEILEEAGQVTLDIVKKILE